MEIKSAHELYEYARHDFIIDELKRKAYLVPMKSMGASEVTKIEDLLVPIANPSDPKYHEKVGHFWFDRYTELRRQEGKAVNLLMRFAKHVRDLDGGFFFPSAHCTDEELESVRDLSC